LERIDMTTADSRTVKDLSTPLAEAADLMRQVALVCGHTADVFDQALGKVDEPAVQWSPKSLTS
jgi:hypothetical protein